MDITLVLKEILDNSDWTEEKVEYVSHLIQVSKNLNKHPELRSITISDLEYINLTEVRLVGKCYNILNVHGFTKQALIEIIRTRYNELTAHILNIITFCYESYFR